MKIAGSKAWFKTANTIIVIGYSLCLGSIASFTSMHMLYINGHARGKTTDRRVLVLAKEICEFNMDYVTMP